MKNVVGLKCLVCSREYGVDDVEYVCPNHGDEGIVDVQYDFDLIGRCTSKDDLRKLTNRTIWRYLPLLPVISEDYLPPLPVGWTPLCSAMRLASELGIKNLWIKDDGRLPTASSKDRASALAVVKARERGARVITTASSGNGAAALSGLCASVNLPNVIFVPETAPKAKIAQALVCGSHVILVKGTYDDAFDLCLQAAREYGWYIRNTGYNPYMTEGKKTAVYEICEQLDWKIPDQIFVSVGDGCIIGGLHKGLRDLLTLGWIDGMPKLIGVQAEGSDYLVQAWENDEDVLKKTQIDPNTVADSIRVGLPRDRLKAMRAVTETRGSFMAVSDDSILKAISILARGTGIFAEPAGATAFAGFLKALDSGMISRDERIVVVNTGNGLKDIDSAMKSAELVAARADLLWPEMDNVRHVVAGWNSVG